MSTNTFHGSSVLPNPIRAQFRGYVNKIESFDEKSQPKSRHSGYSLFSCSPGVFLHDATPSTLFHPRDRPRDFLAPFSREFGYGDVMDIHANFLSPRADEPMRVLASLRDDHSTRDTSSEESTDYFDFGWNKNNSSDDIHSAATTLMLRNIPNKYTRDMLLEDIERRGLIEDIDFFYMPIDLRCKRNVGYCFVNLINQDGVARFRAAFEGTKLGQSNSDKTCQVGIGKVQGLEANIDAYRNTIVMTLQAKFRPLLFVNGKACPFPPPTLSRKELNNLKRDKKGVSSRTTAQRSIEGSPRPAGNEASSLTPRFSAWEPMRLESPIDWTIDVSPVSETY